MMLSLPPVLVLLLICTAVGPAASSETDILASPAPEVTTTVTSLVQSYGDSYPAEVSWELYCTGGPSSPEYNLIAAGGSDYYEEVTIQAGAECYLVMIDSYNDAWQGNVWSGFGNTFDGPPYQESPFTAYLSLTPSPPVPPPRPQRAAPK